MERLVDAQLICMWTDKVNVNPMYHYIRNEINDITRKITNHKLMKYRKKNIPNEVVDNEVLRYQRFYPFAPGLLAIAAALEQSSYSVKLKSLDVERERKEYSYDWLDEIVNEVCNETSRVVMVSCVTTEVPKVIKFLKLIKTKKPELLTVVGGIHSSYFDKDMLKNECIDIVMRHEGEETVVELMNNISNNLTLDRINGISYKKDGVYQRNPDRKFMDLRFAPIPAYHLLDEYTLKRVLLTPTYSRGCPFGCYYCVESHYWKNVCRYKDPVKFVDELEILNKKCNKKFIHIADSTFGIDRKATEKLCDELEKRKLDCLFSINVRPDVFEYLGEELIKRLLSLNFVEFFMGAESASKEVINNLKRKQNKGVFLNALHRLKELEVPLVKLYLMVGGPGENHESMQNTINMINELINQDLIFYATCKFFVPAPGSPLFKDLGDTYKDEWQRYDRYNFPPLYHTSQLSSIELELYLMMIQALQLHKYVNNLSDDEKKSFDYRVLEWANDKYMKEVYF